MRDPLVSSIVGCAAIGVLLSGPPTRAFADQGGDLSRTRSRITLSVSGGLNLGTMGQDFLSALRQSELDDNYCPLEDPRDSVCNPRRTPISSDGRVAYHFALGYAVNPAWEIRALVGGEEDVHAYGVRQVLYRTQLSLAANSVRYAATANYRPHGSVFRAGLGPALQTTEVSGRDDYTRFPSQVGTLLGLVLEGGASFPHRSRLFVDLGFQFWYAGDVAYGPYNVRNGIGNIQVYFPRSLYSLNRAQASAGIGVRIR